MIRYCTKCVIPETKPDIWFDENGVCSACLAFDARPSVNWQERELEFLSIIDRFKGKGRWDCIVPVSGGKDSTFQVIKLLEHGVRPLCVTSTTCDETEVGRRNLRNIGRLGVDCIKYSPNPLVRATLNRVGLKVVGDISWPEHVGIFTIPVIAAVQTGVPLIVWGENSQNEYGGPAHSQESPTLDRAWLEEFGGLVGLRISDIPNLAEGLTDSDLLLYQYPSDEMLADNGVTGLFLGYFFPWDGLSNALLAKAYGFETPVGLVEGSMVDYENLDNHQTGIHDYFKFLKFGFGRTTDIASLQIRRGRISRNEGLEIVRRLDGRYPRTYLGKALEKILEDIGVTKSEFDEICDRFMNREIFLRSPDGMVRRRTDGSPEKLNYDNQS